MSYSPQLISKPAVPQSVQIGLTHSISTKGSPEGETCFANDDIPIKLSASLKNLNHPPLKDSKIRPRKTNTNQEHIPTNQMEYSSSPPRKARHTNSGFLAQPKVEQNVSFTRGAKLPRSHDNSLDTLLGGDEYLIQTLLEGSRSLDHKPVFEQLQRDKTGPGSDSDEDERFLRLAREALVATAEGASGGNLHGLGVVDPTIQDLLRRLQYASSPHGNPIKKSSKIHANDKGKLMIQNFYSQFPNLSNDIFVNEDTEKSKLMSRGGSGWDVLVGEPLQLEPESKFEEEDRKYTCDICQVSFRRCSDLTRHQKKHSDIPANICENCGKGFARKDALKRHFDTLTCKRNAERKLYVENLRFLPRD